MANARRLNELGVPTVLSKELKDQMEASGSTDPGDIIIGAITADNFSFAGGTLTQALQALADAIPAE